MSKKYLLNMWCLLMIASQAKAELQENEFNQGSASLFSGYYSVQERDCEKQFNSVFGQSLLRPEFRFEGKDDGLKIDDGLMIVQPLRLVFHGPHFQAGVSATYKTPKEFVSTFIQINNGLKEVKTDDYVAEINGSFHEITQTTTHTIGERSLPVKVCHYLSTRPL